MLAARERWDEARLLLGRAEGEQRERDGARMNRHRDADACVGTRELLEDEDVRNEVGAGATVLLRHARAHEAELGELSEEIAREAVLSVPLGRVRLDLRTREVARKSLHLFLLRRRLEVHEQDYIEAR